MIITIGQQKGGSGKTTLSMAFANYLSVVKEKPISIIDFDFQKSFYTKYLQDLENTLNKEPLYEVAQVTDSNEKIVTSKDSLQKMKEREDLFLFDIAGNLKKEYVNLIYFSDLIIVPFNYEEKVVFSTIKFAKFCKMVNPDVTLFFIRNNITKRGVYKIKEELDTILNDFGVLINESVWRNKSMESLNTLRLLKGQKENVEKAFEEIIEKSNFLK